MKRDLPDAVVRKSKARKKIGRDLAWDFFDCENTKALTDSSRIPALIQEAGFTVRGVISPAFSGGGYTIAVVIAESRIDLHTWPEEGSVNVGMYYCNFSRDNSDKARVLFESLVEFYKPGDIYRHRSRIPRV